MSEVGDIRVVMSNEDDDTIASRISRAGRRIIEMQSPGSELIGYATVAIYEDGLYSVGYQMPEDHAFLSPTLFIAMLKTIIERDMTGKLAADDFFKAHFG